MSSFPASSSSSFGSQSQIAAIMDVLAKAAVAEISKLVDDGTVVLRLEMCRKDSEIEELKRSLQLMCRKDGEIEELKRSLQAAERELCKAREAAEAAAIARIAEDHQKQQQRCVLLGRQVSLEEACQGDLETDATYSESKGVNSLFESGHQPEESRDLGLQVKFEPVDKMDDQETIENSAITNNDAFVTEDHCGPQWPSLHDLCEGDSIEPQLFEAHTDQYSTQINNQNSCNSSLSVAGKVSNTVDNLCSFIKEETEVQPVSLGDNMPAMADSTIQTELYVNSHVSHHQPVNGEARRLHSGLQQAGPSHGTEEHNFNRSALKAKRPMHVWRAGTSLLSRLFTCSVCGRGFPRLCQLEAHQFTHGTVKPFRCLECGKSFTQKTRLKTHQSVHTGERPFSCQICGKMFSRQDNCLRHERFHSGLRPYSCGQCGKSFTVLGNLKIHQEIHRRGR